MVSCLGTTACCGLEAAADLSAVATYLVEGDIGVDY
jgi:hypothetical protein